MSSNEHEEDRRPRWEAVLDTVGQICWIRTHAQKGWMHDDDATPLEHDNAELRKQVTHWHHVTELNCIDRDARAESDEQAEVEMERLETEIAKLREKNERLLDDLKSRTQDYLDALEDINTIAGERKELRDKFAAAERELSSTERALAHFKSERDAALARAALAEGSP